MAEMLTYISGQSTGEVFRRSGRVEYADENYAREIMQLFSVGFNKLNLNGTLVQGPGGAPLNTCKCFTSQTPGYGWRDLRSFSRFVFRYE